MKRQFRFLMLSVVAVSLALISCEDDDDVQAPTQNVVQLAQGADNLATLEAALVKFPDLVATLSGNSQFTVFAPTDAAFQTLLSAVGQTSLNDIPDDVLRDILEYHVVAGTTLSNQLNNGTVATVGGENITVSTAGGISLNGTVGVVTADIRATNGVVHIIDEVLVPPSMQPIVGTIVAPAFFNRNFTTLIAAVRAAPPAILQTLLTTTNKTLFAPTNEAFVAAGITTLPNQATLDAVLKYHVINSEVTSAQIANGASVAPTLNGNIYLSKNSNSVFINGRSKVTTADIDASNGVVHVIDRTLMPPSETITQIATRLSTASPAQFTQLVAALARTQGQGANDLLAAASAPGSNLTVFAPTDAAFQQLYNTLGVNGVNDIPLTALINVLKHHIVASRVFSTDLTNGSVATLNGNVTIAAGTNPTVTGSQAGTNTANLQTSLLNILATNGVIHVIDRVIIPQ